MKSMNFWAQSIAQDGIVHLPGRLELFQRDRRPSSYLLSITDPERGFRDEIVRGQSTGC